MLVLALLTLLSCLNPIFGKIASISAPSIIPAGKNFTVVIHTTSYIQNWDDFGIIFGLKSPNLTSDPIAVGDEIGYSNLYGVEKLPNVTVSVSCPIWASGKYTLVGAVPYLVGASGETGIQYFNQSISVTPTPAK
ncbi:hypothetical protein M231_04372 [Tremella mesenterica]|uniref:Uncharacterized protein n=1 Tax=Tremella mesenterica TaxID=5217 RepID=A0A4Q1BKY8_TREME|nr:uncharacterized protein TREMEDRAFT_62449 [Tremella mesenterica DSM 1558]EIW69589.1 hypothetical protein TREMEDRAFT_62449 [Tremella mesenterica DSM 1558]RXK38330.1 hypothetical protein M231_04372 [Tremella mesenterica]